MISVNYYKGGFTIHTTLKLHIKATPSQKIYLNAYEKIFHRYLAKLTLSQKSIPFKKPYSKLVNFATQYYLYNYFKKHPNTSLIKSTRSSIWPKNSFQLNEDHLLLKFNNNFPISNILLKIELSSDQLIFIKSQQLQRIDLIRNGTIYFANLTLFSPDINSSKKLVSLSTINEHLKNPLSK